MAAHLTRDAGGPSPPGRNEVLLREAVDRLRLQLDAARKVADQLAGVVYDHRKECPCTRCEVLHAFDKAMGGK